jgi:hypothetical protein
VVVKRAVSVKVVTDEVAVRRLCDDPAEVLGGVVGLRDRRGLDRQAVPGDTVLFIGLERVAPRIALR